MIRRTAVLAAIVAALIAVPTAANADPGTTITPSATTLTIGDTLSVNVSGPVNLVAGSFTWTPVSTTGSCTVTQAGSYTNGGQKTTAACTGADTLVGKATSSGTLTFTADGVYAFTVTVNPLPIVTPPPPAPAPKLVPTESQCAGTYSATLANSGNADLVNGSWSSSYCTPLNLAAVTLPAGATIGARIVCNRRHVCYPGIGYVVRGLNIPVGATAVVSFAVTP